MKAQCLFEGSTSYGAPVQAAQAINGQWFLREYRYNGFGRGWGRWNAIEAPTHPTQLKNQCEYADAPEYVELTPEESLNYVTLGFKTLRKISSTPKVRLPD